MREAYFIISLVVILVLGVLTWSYRERYNDSRRDFIELLLVKPDTVTKRDTIIDTATIFLPKWKTRLVKDTLYLQCPDDSIGIEIEQKQYGDSGIYDAYVSGYKPSLDSIKIYTTTYYDTVRIEKTIPVSYERKGIWIQSNKNKDKYYGIGSIKR